MTDEDAETEGRDPTGANRPTGGGRTSRGPNPDPGGKIEPGGDVPPYDERSQDTGDSPSSEALTDSVERQLGETKTGKPGSTTSPPMESPVGENEVAHGSAGGGDSTADDPKGTSLHGVGESTGTRGEDQKD